MEFANLIYVDPSIETGGDGLTPATALKTLPAAASLATDTMYLIRRTAEETFLAIPTGTSSATRLAFVGMPQASEDPARYALMPEAARTAWGTDSAAKAQLRITSTAYLTLNAMLDFELYNINLIRSAAVSYSGYGAFYLTRARAGSPNITNWYNGTVSIDRCRFAAAGEAIDLAAYATAPTAGMGCCYLTQSGAVDNIFIANTVVNFVPPASGGGAYGLAFTNPYGNVCLANVRIYAVTSGSSVSGGMSAGCAINIANGVQWAMTRIRDIHVRYRRTEGMQYPGALNFSNVSYGAIDTDAKGIVVDEGDHFGTPEALAASTSILKIVAGAGPCVIEDIAVDLPQLWNVTSGNPVVYCGNSVSTGSMYGGLSAGLPRRASNIRVTLAGEAGGLGDHCTMDQMKAISSGQTSYRMYYAALGLKGLDCIGVAVTANWLRAVVIEGGSLEATAITGNIFNYGARLKIGTLSSSWPACLLTVSSACMASIENLEGDAATSTTDDYVIFENETSLSQSYIFITRSNKPVKGVQPLYPASAVNQYFPYTSGALTVNHNGTVGRITVYGLNYVTDTWSSRRVNGAGASIKMWGNQGFNATALPIGMSPAMVTPKTIDGAQALNITVHVAFFAISDYVRDFIIEAVTATGAIISSGGGQWSDDADEWSDVAEGVAPKKWSCSVPGNTVAFRFYFRGYDPNGYLFLDPEIEVTEA